jgi:hypothetical protein
MSSATRYDFDADPKRRHQSPEFYGMLPDDATKRLIVFVSISVNSTLLLLIR